MKEFELVLFLNSKEYQYVVNRSNKLGISSSMLVHNFLTENGFFEIDKKEERKARLETLYFQNADQILDPKKNLEEFKTLCKKLKITQEHLANYFNVTQAAISYALRQGKIGITKEIEDCLNIPHFVFDIYHKTLIKEGTQFLLSIPNIELKEYYILFFGYIKINLKKEEDIIFYIQNAKKVDEEISYIKIELEQYNNYLDDPLSYKNVFDKAFFQLKALTQTER